ncbi:MAG: hypothetical protein IIC54_00705 [Proteobacteria bacterium]|nr:hypothetical protein [Pseudomonadota bacterium]
MAFDPNSMFLVHTTGSPFADEPPDSDAYYAAIGRLMVLWGRFEQNLENVVQDMSSTPGAPKPPSGRPRSYKKKVEHLKLYCRDTPCLTPLLEYAREFSSRALLIGPKRHEIVHANWQGFIANAPELTVKFANIRWEGERSKRTKRDIPISELSTLTSQIHTLNGDAMNFMRLTIELSGQQGGNKS